MATEVLTDCSIKIGGVNYSGQGTNVAVTYSAEAVDLTGFGTTTRVHAGGTKEWAMELEFNQDEAVSGATFFTAVGTTMVFEVKPRSAATSISNPCYSGIGLITAYTPLAGGLGEASKVSLSVVSAGPLARLTI